MEEIAKGFTSKQYEIIERIVQHHIHDWVIDDFRRTYRNRIVVSTGRLGSLF